MSQSVGNSLVSGTVADMFSPDQRGTPMGLFTLATFLGQVREAFHTEAYRPFRLTADNRWDGFRVGRPGARLPMGLRCMSGSLRFNLALNHGHNQTNPQIQGIAAGATCVLNVLFVRETRIDNLLEKRARELTKKTGIKHVCRGAASKKQGFEVLATSCLRPLSGLT
jgi:hypothetical protein